MEEIRQMMENYEMGFIDPLHFLMAYHRFLQVFGAHKCIEDKINEQLRDLAEGVLAILKDGNKSNNMIENFGSVAFSFQS